MTKAEQQVESEVKGVQEGGEEVSVKVDVEVGEGGGGVEVKVDVEEGGGGGEGEVSVKVDAEIEQKEEEQAPTDPPNEEGGSFQSTYRGSPMEK